MRIRTFGMWLVMMLLLHGCASPAPQSGTEATAKPKGLQLFDANTQPRFNFYLACVSQTVNCEIIERQFDDWADTRHLTVHSVAANDPAFATGKPSSPAEQAKPYRVSVRYTPEMAAANNSLAGAGRGMPIMSYAATVHVFDAATGDLLKTMSFHDEKMIDQNLGSANPYLQAQIRAFLSHLDPQYVKGGSAS